MEVEEPAFGGRKARQNSLRGIWRVNSPSDDLEATQEKRRC